MVVEMPGNVTGQWSFSNGADHRVPSFLVGSNDGAAVRDLIEHALSIGAYLNMPRGLTIDLLAEACATYFVEDRDLATA